MERGQAKRALGWARLGAAAALLKETEEPYQEIRAIEEIRAEMRGGFALLWVRMQSRSSAGEDPPVMLEQIALALRDGGKPKTAKALLGLGRIAAEEIERGLGGAEFDEADASWLPGKLLAGKKNPGAPRWVRADCRREWSLDAKSAQGIAFGGEEAARGLEEYLAAGSEEGALRPEGVAKAEKASLAGSIRGKSAERVRPKKV